VSLKDRIVEAENQLMDPVDTLSNTTNAQTDRNIPIKMGKNIITPGTRDAPKFSSQRPHELRRFIRMMEDMWDEAGITNDDVRKETIVKYVDQDSEEEWKALEAFENGYSWDEFKKELISNYPEAAAAERGTPARIRQLCAETKGIKLGDTTALYTFRRAFTTEAKKLSKPPAAMSNRELVELFIGSLSEQMATAVLQFLGNKTSREKEGTDGGKLNRRPEDKYDIDEVCKAAILVSEGSQGMFHLLNKPVPELVNGKRAMLFNHSAAVEATGLTQKLEEIENLQAQERYKLEIVNKNVDVRFNELESMMKTLLSQVQSNASNTVNTGWRSKQYDPSSGVKLGTPGTMPKWGSGSRLGDGSGCFYCSGLDHMMGSSCEEMMAAIKAGWVKLNAEGKLRLGDGSYIPSVPNAANIKERVEKFYAKRQSQYYLGDEEEDDAPSLSINRTPVKTLAEDPARRRARLEYELDLKEREEAIELKQLKIERDEKRKEGANRATRAAQVLEMIEQLTEEELAAVKTVKPDFR
jgi:hypothetical protein